ncbi:hypothetical protein Enr10x_41620 [Gimesia panareensis]|uniref:Uncharacterized protein n=1 Tax=Gimesia panareensis TaxID=2527978 RepID=A0A518AAB2_9PLAN|nr:hypothetical protein Enr10x_41620 [Gimesia panareensis]QDU51658.1 hypothetical protein Pan110_40250 [Gimesia panareensis]
MTSGLYFFSQFLGEFFMIGFLLPVQLSDCALSDRFFGKSTSEFALTRENRPVWGGI